MARPSKKKPAAKKKVTKRKPVHVPASGVWRGRDVSGKVISKWERDRLTAKPKTAKEAKKKAKYELSRLKAMGTTRTRASKAQERRLETRLKSIKRTKKAKKAIKKAVKPAVRKAKKAIGAATGKVSEAFKKFADRARKTTPAAKSSARPSGMFTYATSPVRPPGADKPHGKRASTAMARTRLTPLQQADVRKVGRGAIRGVKSLAERLAKGVTAEGRRQAAAKKTAEKKRLEKRVADTAARRKKARAAAKKRGHTTAVTKQRARKRRGK